MIFFLRARGQSDLYPFPQYPTRNLSVWSVVMAKFWWANVNVTDHEVYLPPQTLAWCAAQLAQIGFHDVPVSGHFIGKDRVFRMPWYFKAVLTNARLHELSGVDRALPLEDRNIALLDSLKAGYHHVPAAAVVRGWKESSSVEYVQFAEEYMQDAMGASDRE